MHQQGIDYSYVYENPLKAAGSTLNNNVPSYLYNGYSHGADFQVMGEGGGSKRRTSAEAATREYKRTKPDGYYYDNNQNGFA